MKRYSKLMTDKDAYRKKRKFMDFKILYKNHEQAKTKMQNLKENIKIKNFLTLQRNKHKIKKQKDHKKLNKIISEKNDVKDIFEMIYKNRYSKKNLKKDIMKLINMRSKTLNPKPKKSSLKKTSSNSTVKKRDPSTPLEKENENKELLQNPYKMRKKPQEKLRIVHFRASSEQIGSITSIDSSSKKKKFLFNGLSENYEKKVKTVKRKPKVKIKSTNSVDKKFAKKLIKQSFLKINKDMLKKQIKVNLLAMKKNASSNNLFLNEIFKEQPNFSLYDSFSDLNNRDDMLKSFVHRLKNLFYKKGFKSQSTDNNKKKKKLKNIIRQNLHFFKKGTVKAF